MKGFISGEDFSLFTITKNEREAVEAIETFYRNYHSMRFIDHRLVIRLNKALSPEQINTLEELPNCSRRGNISKAAGRCPKRPINRTW